MSEERSVELPGVLSRYMSDKALGWEKGWSKSNHSEFAYWAYDGPEINFLLLMDKIGVIDLIRDKDKKDFIKRFITI